MNEIDLNTTLQFPCDHWGRLKKKPVRKIDGFMDWWNRFSQMLVLKVAWCCSPQTPRPRSPQEAPPLTHRVRMWTRTHARLRSRMSTRPRKLSPARPRAAGANCSKPSSLWTRRTVATLALPPWISHKPPWTLQPQSLWVNGLTWQSLSWMDWGRWWGSWSRFLTIRSVFRRGLRIRWPCWKTWRLETKQESLDDPRRSLSLSSGNMHFFFI